MKYYPVPPKNQNQDHQNILPLPHNRIVLFLSIFIIRHVAVSIPHSLTFLAVINTKFKKCQLAPCFRELEGLASRR